MMNVRTPSTSPDIHPRANISRAHAHLARAPAPEISSLTAAPTATDGSFPRPLTYPRRVSQWTSSAGTS